MYRELPAKPNLEHLKNQAKELLHAFQQGEAAAKERFAALSAFSAVVRRKSVPDKDSIR